MDTKKLTQLIAIGEIAIEFVKAGDEVIDLRDQYNFSIRDYEAEHGTLGGRIDKSNPDHQGAIEYSAPAYAKYRNAVRRKNNIKKRMTTAVRRSICA